MTRNLDEPGLVQEPAALPRPQVLQLHTPHDVALVRRALTNEKVALTKLAGKVTDSGYPLEARSMGGDARSITEQLLVQLKDQGELDLLDTTRDALTRILRLRLAPLVRSKPAESQQADAPLDTAVTVALEVVEWFARGVGERAYAAGQAASTHTFEGFAAATVMFEDQTDLRG